MPNRTRIRSFPSSSLGMQSWKLQLPDSRSCDCMDAGGRATQGAVAESFANWVPKPELGNQRKRRTVRRFIKIKYCTRYMRREIYIGSVDLKLFCQSLLSYPHTLLTKTNVHGEDSAEPIIARPSAPALAIRRNLAERHSAMTRSRSCPASANTDWVLSTSKTSAAPLS